MTIKRKPEARRRRGAQRKPLSERKRGAEGLARYARKLAGCANWPVRECLVGSEWQDSLAARIFISRTRPDGRPAVAVFFVDLGCLGVKWAIIEPLVSPERYASLRSIANKGGASVRCDPELAVKIVDTGVEYAAGLGFSPADKDYESARMLLRGFDAANCVEPVVCGRDGKPFYIGGPHDDQVAVIAQLETRLGRDGFDFISGV